MATAPSGDGGHVNVSPKGGPGMFRVTGPLSFAYADMLGSGVETVSHLQENGRICVMFTAFEGPPKILRLHGTGRVVQHADPEFEALLAGFDIDEDQRVTVRSIITVKVARVADACGYQVPRMDFVADRDQLVRYADNRLRKEGRGRGEGLRDGEQRREHRRPTRPRPARRRRRRPRGGRRDLTHGGRRRPVTRPP